MKVKIGFEIHQQLSGSKLFCSCPAELTDAQAQSRVFRRLRPTQSELGEIDQAALEEHLKGRFYEYEVTDDQVCLVELDEEPPHLPSMHALDASLEIATLLNARVVDEVHFMRKLVIDGSNTSGFQRTAIVALNGYLETSQGRVRVPSLCLEEEAARKLGEEGRKVTYHLDRLGIPLVEITTSPDIRSGEQALEVAKKIGDILRSTGKVRRGLGTIRQDLNISTREGARVEIKGVQELSLIPTLVEKEVERQKALVEVQKELEIRGVEKVDSRIVDLSSEFEDSKSRVISRALEDKGKVLGIKLEGFEGLLSGKLGPEMADYARVKAGTRGIFHGEELPAYGIGERELRRVRGVLEVGEKDAFVLVGGEEEQAFRALEAVLERARTALEGLPEETRMARKDGSTSYMRPLPGAARMYPETDIPPLAIGEGKLKRIEENLPELIEEKAERLRRQYGLEKEVASQMARSDYVEIFERVAEKDKKLASFFASVLLSTMREISREGLEVYSIGKKDVEGLLVKVGRGEVTKEAVPQVLRVLSQKPLSVGEALEELGLKSMEEGELREIVREVLERKRDFIEQKGEKAQKPLMGEIMKEVRGRASGREVNMVLGEELKRFIERR